MGLASEQFEVYWGARVVSGGPGVHLRGASVKGAWGQRMYTFYGFSTFGNTL